MLLTEHYHHLFTCNAFTSPSYLYTNGIEPLPGCNSEQAAAGVLGYTQVSWDNLSGEEKQPSLWKQDWIALMQHEQAAAIALGYTKTSWDDDSGSEAQPTSEDKYWSEFTSCGEDLSIYL